MPDLVSVIIPTYNRRALTIRAVESVLAQTYPHFEVIVVDDGSTDDTIEYLSRIPDPRVKVLPIKHSGHPSIARNAGIEIAKGEYIALLDSDDEWLPPKLEKQVEVFTKLPATGMVCSDAYKIDLNGEEISLYHGKKLSAGYFTLNRLLKSNPVICSSALIRKKIFSDVGLFSHDFVFRAAEDYVFWLRMARSYPIYYLDCPLLNYRVTQDSLTLQATRSQTLHRLINILDWFGREYPDSYKENKITIRQKISEYYYQLQKDSAEIKDIKRFFLYWYKAFQRTPFSIRNLKKAGLNLILLVKSMLKS